MTNETDDFRRKMSEALTQGNERIHTHLPLTLHEVNPGELKRREREKAKIPDLVNEGLDDEAIAKELSLPLALVTEFIRFHSLRPRVSDYTLSRTPEMTAALFSIWRERIIELRSLDWTVERMSEDIGLDILTIQYFVQKLLQEGALSRRDRSVYNGNSKLPLSYRRRNKPQR